MESADNTEDDEDDEYVELNGDASPSVGNGRVNGEGAGSHDEEEEKDEVMDTTVDEHGNHFLADGQCRYLRLSVLSVFFVLVDTVTCHSCYCEFTTGGSVLILS